GIRDFHVTGVQTCALPIYGLSDLVGVDRQKQLLEANTEQFVKGLPANNALLWGARGTGKSSLVRALLATCADQGLRLIEIDKGDLRSEEHTSELQSRENLVC